MVQEISSTNTPIQPSATTRTEKKGNFRGRSTSTSKPSENTKIDQLRENQLGSITDYSQKLNAIETKIAATKTLTEPDKHEIQKTVQQILGTLKKHKDVTERSSAILQGYRILLSINPDKFAHTIRSDLSKLLHLPFSTDSKEMEKQLKEFSIVQKAIPILNTLLEKSTDKLSDVERTLVIDSLKIAINNKTLNKYLYKKENKNKAEDFLLQLSYATVTNSKAPINSHMLNKALIDSGLLEFAQFVEDKQPRIISLKNQIYASLKKHKTITKLQQELHELNLSIKQAFKECCSKKKSDLPMGVIDTIHQFNDLSYDLLPNRALQEIFKKDTNLKEILSITQASNNFQNTFIKPILQTSEGATGGDVIFWHESLSNTLDSKDKEVMYKRAGSSQDFPKLVKAFLGKDRLSNIQNYITGPLNHAALMYTHEDKLSVGEMVGIKFRSSSFVLRDAIENIVFRPNFYSMLNETGKQKVSSLWPQKDDETNEAYQQRMNDLLRLLNDKEIDDSIQKNIDTLSNAKLSFARYIWAKFVTTIVNIPRKIINTIKNIFCRIFHIKPKSLKDPIIYKWPNEDDLKFKDTMLCSEYVLRQIFISLRHVETKLNELTETKKTTELFRSILKKGKNPKAIHPGNLAKILSQHFEIMPQHPISLALFGPRSEFEEIKKELQK